MVDNNKNNSSKIKGLEFLSKSSSIFLTLQPEDNIHEFIAESLYNFYDKNCVVFSNVYDKETNTISIEYIAGIGRLKTFVNYVLEKDPLDMKFELKEYVRDILSKGVLATAEGGIYELTGEQIPKPVCAILEKTFNITSFHGMAYMKGDNLFGNMIILMRHNQKIDDFNIIETFVNLASNALQKRQAENDLIDLNRNLENRIVERTADLENAIEKIKLENYERKLAQEKLNLTTEELSKSLNKEKELNTLKSQFISTVSHEYRTPLTVILNSTYIIEKSLQLGKFSEVNSYLDKIKSAVNHMNQMLENVIDINKNENKKINVKKTKFNLVELVKEIVLEQNFVTQNSHDIKLNFQDEKLHIKSDSDLLFHAISNLVSNAIKYSDTKTVIEISIVEESDFYRISIKDNGRGIPEDEINNIFDVFYRTKEAVHIKGTGIGLAIVKRNIEMLSGEVFCESKLNKGSTFTIKIPIS